MLPIADVQALAVALGIGLLVGIDRERRKGQGVPSAAGIRTFALVGLAGAVSMLLGPVGLAIGGAFVVLAALAGYRATRAQDPGLTTEVALVVVFLLGALAVRQVVLAAGLGVAVAVLLAAKLRLHGFAREALGEQELHDALLLAAAAAIVLPLLPDRAIDPWGVLNLRRLWMLAVIVMAITAVGHVALRVFGARIGLPLAGLAGGFVSSTATIASMGARTRQDPALSAACASAGVVSNISTVVQLGAITTALAPALARALALPLLASGAAVALYAVALAWRTRGAPAPDATHVAGRPFEPKHVLGFVAIVATVMLVSAAMLDWLGHAALEWTLAVSGLADVHAAAASAAQLVAVGRIGIPPAMLAILLAFVANSATKVVLAFATGGRAYGLRLLPGIVAMLVAFALVAWFDGPMPGGGALRG
jgi:uncharacterized membrane protein (DUF4010 family)